MRKGCELLSKVCIFATANNAIRSKCTNREVVNCFQKFVSLQPLTTFKFPLPSTTGCELLSKVCIFATANN